MPLLQIHIILYGINRYFKRLVMVCVDAVALTFALWSAYALRLTELWPQAHLKAALPLFYLVPVVGIIIFVKLGLYRAVLRFLGTQVIWAVFKGVMILSVLIAFVAYSLDITPFSRSVPINFALAALLYVGGSRILLRNYYHWLIKRFVSKEPVLIYGAGGAGVQLFHALNGGAEFVPVGFIDDDNHLWRSSVAGLDVYCPDDLDKVIEEFEVKQILLAMPKLSASDRRNILEKLSEFSIKVRTIPSMPELLEGSSIEKIRDISLEDLLGRDPVPPKEELIASSIASKTVMVTGAGGSIGSEIARQVLANHADKLILLEISEFALYQIDQELRDLKADDNSCEIYPVLGSVLDSSRLKSVFDKFQVQTVYHAAAYKHVPMVEHNVLEGVRNNFIGTFSLAQQCAQANVERFILISTDKAVRPTNVMGASKRAAEMALQDFAAHSGSSTIFSMVRFGNVLGSSGSVVPLFTRQIKAGGPVTVTHPEITRFFMTIPEATSLVIQAGSMAIGGEVFLLDMGEPVKILDMAKRMIHLMGFETKDDKNPNGDIAITFRGLRPGEKLYEELLIGENVSGTEHPKIMRANEELLSHAMFETFLKNMHIALASADTDQIRKVLIEQVTGFTPMSDNVDWLLNESSLKIVN